MINSKYRIKEKITPLTPLRKGKTAPFPLRRGRVGNGVKSGCLSV